MDSAPGLDHEQNMRVGAVRRPINRELHLLEEEIEQHGMPTPGTARAVHAKSKAPGIHALQAPRTLRGAGQCAADRILCDAQFGAGRHARQQIAMVRVHASETLGRVVDRAVQVFGGMGYCKDMPIERYYRDARIHRIFDGTSEIHRTVIARSVMNQGRPCSSCTAERLAPCLAE